MCGCWSSTTALPLTPSVLSSWPRNLSTSDSTLTCATWFWTFLLTNHRLCTWQALPHFHNTQHWGTKGLSAEPPPLLMCHPSFDSNIIVKFADDTTVIGRLTMSQTTGKGLRTWSVWAGTTTLPWKLKKTKERIMDFRRGKHRSHHSITINGERVEEVQSFWFLRVHISKDLLWTLNMSAMKKVFRCFTSSWA